MKTRSLITRSLFVILVLLAGSQTSFAAGASPIPLQMDSRSTMTHQVTESGKRVGAWKRWRANRQEKRGAREYEIFATLSALMGVPGFIMIIQFFTRMITNWWIFLLAILLVFSGLTFGIYAFKQPQQRRYFILYLLNMIGLVLSGLGALIVSFFFFQFILIALRIDISGFPLNVFSYL